jgi:hypothetical protein
VNDLRQSMTPIFINKQVFLESRRIFIADVGCWKTKHC